MSSQPTAVKPFYRRRPLALALALLLVSLGSWIALFLVRFDLNDYREQLQARLSEYLEMPVQLGTAHLRLRDVGIAVSFDDIHLGDEQTVYEIESPEFWVVLEWQGLLQRQLRFSRVGLIRPEVRITQPAPEPAPVPSQEPTRQPFDIGMLLDTQIHNLAIHDGRLQISSRDELGESRTLMLSDISATVQGLGLGSPCQIDLRGSLQQEEHPAQLALLGSIELPSTAASWQATSLDLHLDLTGLESTTLLRYRPTAAAGLTASGRLDGALQFSGTPADGLTVRTEFRATDLLVRPGGLYAEGVPVHSLRTSGIIRQGEHSLRIEELDLALDGLSAAGTLQVERGPGGPAVQIRLTDSTLPIAAVKRWLPGNVPAADRLRRQLAGQGTLRVERGELRFGPGDAPPGAWLQHLQGTADGLAWDLANGQNVELSSLQFSCAESLCRLDDGRLQVGPLAIGFDGTLTTPPDRPVAMELKASGQSASAELLKWLWPQSPAQLVASGPVTISTQLTGTPEQLLADLDVDLGQLELSYADALKLPIDSSARFNLHGTLNAQGFGIDHAHLHWQSLEGWLNGRVAPTDPTGTRLQARLEITDLATARKLSPYIADLDMHGAATVDLAWPAADQGSPAAINISLSEVAIATGDAIGDLSHINGRLRLADNGLQSEAMRAHLGSSPLRFQARVADLTNPVLDLEVEAAAIRADELIFFSDRSMLRNIKGKMAISSSAVELKPVDVTLDGGTQASVRGRIEIAKQPKVFLDITSDYARVDEIIGLWTDESESSAAARHVRHQQQSGPRVQAEVKILAHAKTGDLYGMAFQKAEAVIIPRPDMLVIHPLDFRVEEGFCNAQVLVDFAADGPPLLRISGHTEDVDAYQIHNELLKRKSILRGRLRGDFYLQGRTGKTFLPTSYGNFHLMIRDGVLRQMPFLSKVFSILNVSQLFALKLPDMAVEGLPFSELSGDLLLDKGVFKSEGLVVKSEAMNQTYLGEFSLIENRLDLTMAVQPLGTVDKIVSRLPVAGWLLTGEDKALITAHFTIKGNADDPEVDAIPATSISSAAMGIIRRTLGLPVKLVEKPSLLWGGD